MYIICNDDGDRVFSSVLHEGDSVKVHIPGEFPWATVTEVRENGEFRGKFDNKLVGSIEFEQGREVTFVKCGKTGYWEARHDA